MDALNKNIDQLLLEHVLEDNNAMRKSGFKLAEAAMFVVRECDGLHRLSKAVADWNEVITNEGGRKKIWYKKCQEEWFNLWNELDLSNKGWTTPWLNNQFADGTDMLDGNPIFSFINNEQKKAVRIIQLEKIDFSTWIDRFDPDGENVLELVVCTSFSISHISKARDSILSWVNP